jgi:hypothetical protein
MATLVDVAALPTAELQRLAQASGDVAPPTHTADQVTLLPWLTEPLDSSVALAPGARAAALGLSRSGKVAVLVRSSSTAGGVGAAGGVGGQPHAPGRGEWEQLHRLDIAALLRPGLPSGGAGTGAGSGATVSALAWVQTHLPGDRRGAAPHLVLAVGCSTGHLLLFDWAGRCVLKQLVDREPVLSLKYRPPAFAGGSGLPELDGEDAQVAGDGGGGGGGGARTDEGDLSLLHGGGVLSHFSGADICSLLAESPAAAYGSLGDSHEAAQLPYRKWKLKGQTLVADAVCCGHKPLGLGELDPSTPLDKLDPHSASSHGASSEGATSYQLLAAVRGQRAPLAPPPPTRSTLAPCAALAVRWERGGWRWRARSKSSNGTALCQRRSLAGSRMWRAVASRGWWRDLLCVRLAGQGKDPFIAGFVAEGKPTVTHVARDLAAKAAARAGAAVANLASSFWSWGKGEPEPAVGGAPGAKAGGGEGSELATEAAAMAMAEEAPAERAVSVRCAPLKTPLTRRARIALGTATQCTPPPPLPAQPRACSGASSPVHVRAAGQRRGRCCSTPAAVCSRWRSAPPDDSSLVRHSLATPSPWWHACPVRAAPTSHGLY